MAALGPQAWLLIDFDSIGMTPLPQYAGTAKGGGAGIGGGGAPVVGRQPDLKQRDRMQRALARVQRFCIKHALPLGFLVGLIWALTWPEPGQATAEIVVGKTASNPKGLRLIEFLNNVNVFLVSGLTLRTDDFRHLARHWTAPAYGAIGILLITPLLALLAKVLPLQPSEFATGLAIFSVVPTTLGVGVALTQVAHGNQALALLLTVSTNLLGVVTVPYLLHAFLTGGATTITINPSTLAVKLVATVLAPTVLGMAIRASHPRVRRWIAHHKTKLSLFSTFNLVMIIWQTLSAARGVLLRQSAAHLVLVAVAAISQHLIYLAFNWVVATRVLNPPPAEAVAVVIMASQKSAPVAVTVISYLTEDVAQQGLFAIPCLIGQLAQIFIGSLLAAKFAAWVDRADAANAAAVATAGGQQGGDREGALSQHQKSYQNGAGDEGKGVGGGEGEGEEEQEVVDGIL